MKKQNEESILDSLVIAAPCSITWESMEGNDRQRQCGGCNKSVYNISDMTRTEAERFLKERGSAECMRFFRRTDGTIMTDDCPRALRKIRDQYRFASRALASVVALMFAVPSAIAQNRSVPMLMGKPARTNNATSQPLPHQYAAGGPIFVRPDPSPSNQTVTTSPAVTTTTQVTLLTREVTLPDGRRVTLVVPNRNGDVIWMRSLEVRPTVNPARTPAPLTELPAHSKNVETQALQFYIKAQDLRHQGNLTLSEFYLEKALSSFDLQKNQSDTKFRSTIESDLKSLRDQIEIQAGSSRASATTDEESSAIDDEPGDVATPAELPKDGTSD